MQPTRLPSKVIGLLLLVLSFGKSSLGAPHRDSPYERLRNKLELPDKYLTSNKAGLKAPPPYPPDHRDPLDNAIDAVGNHLDPVPYRNGLGASVLGPWNRERSRTNPDLVR